jgi:nicotinamide riboside kinase
MNIAFAGASGCGKTTLVNHLVALYGGVVNPNGSRSMARTMGFESPYDVDRASLKAYQRCFEEGIRPLNETATKTREQNAAQTAMDVFAAGHHDGFTVRALFQKRLRAAKIEWERSQKTGFISDRTTLDDLVYTLLHARETVSEENIKEAVDHLEVYDIIFYCPIECGQWLDGDTNRMDDVNYHLVYDATLRGLLWRYDVPYIQIEDRHLSARKGFVQDAVAAWRSQQ